MTSPTRFKEGSSCAFQALGHDLCNVKTILVENELVAEHHGQNFMDQFTQPFHVLYCVTQNEHLFEHWFPDLCQMAAGIQPFTPQSGRTLPNSQEDYLINIPTSANLGPSKSVGYKKYIGLRLPFWLMEFKTSEGWYFDEGWGILFISNSFLCILSSKVCAPSLLYLFGLFEGLIFLFEFAILIYLIKVVLKE